MSPVKNSKKIHPDASTQRYLPFSQIRENIMMLKDNSARIVMKCSTINFLLKNTEEQDAIIVSFQRFLNSLDFPIQIMIRSSKLDIDAYLQKLNDKALTQENTLLQNQTYEYIEYLRKLVEVAQIMKKEFYIVIPYDEAENKSVKNDGVFGMFENFWQSINGNDTLIKVKTQLKNFAKIKKGLVGRANMVQVGLENIGIKGEVLGKTELISFLTEYYNPSLSNLSYAHMDVSKNDLIPQ
ncbi:hypothetical protein MK079_01345 [Candidatus Gracilibacteria bacterium]|nr:hypothetical protein [Candidatus Gracilibacteria bacterium]